LELWPEQVWCENGGNHCGMGTIVAVVEVDVQVKKIVTMVPPWGNAGITA